MRCRRAGRYLLGVVICATLGAGCATTVSKEKAAFSDDVSRDQAYRLELRGPLAGPDLPADHQVFLRLLAHWQQGFKQEEVSRALRESGDLVSGMEQACRSRGLWFYASIGSLAYLTERVGAEIPVLVSYRENARRDGARVYAIVTGYDYIARVLELRLDRNRTVYSSFDDFEIAWAADQHRMFVVCPPEKITWKIGRNETVGLASFYEQTGALEGAVQLMEALRKNELSNMEAHLKAGNLWRRVGRLDEAEAAYRDALRLSDFDGRAANNLAYLLAEKNDSLDEAEVLARRAYQLEPTNPVVLDTLGFVYMQRKQWAEAARFLERARSRAAKMDRTLQAEIALHLAQTYHADHQPMLARQVLQQARELNPGLAVSADLEYLLAEPGKNNTEF